MSNFVLFYQEVIGVDADGDPIGSEPVELASTNDTKPTELRLLMNDKIRQFDAAGISRESYRIWTTPTPPVREVEH